MITKIILNGVASYGNPGAILQTGSRTNLIYGHNGTGKSTIANYLQNPHDALYSDCSFEDNGSQPELLVYNEKFIEANFHEAQQPGVFTLSETNKAVEAAIETADIALKKVIAEQAEVTAVGKKLAAQQADERSALKDKVWAAKTQFERSALGFCLEGYKGNKDKFLERIGTSKIPDKDVIEADLSKQAAELSNAIGSEKVAPRSFLLDLTSIEKASIFSELLVGSNDSYLSALIQKLGNADWVNEGRSYLDNAGSRCPFCQQHVEDDFSSEIARIFDGVYNQKITTLNDHLAQYRNSFSVLAQHLMSPVFEDAYFSEDEKFEVAKKLLLSQIQANIELILKKISAPSKPVDLVDSSAALQGLNTEIVRISQKIEEYNSRIVNRKNHLNRITSDFWSMLKSRYAEPIAAAEGRIALLEEQLTKQREQYRLLNENAEKLKNEISSYRAKSTNIDLSIDRINNTIDALGLQGFKLVKAQDNENKYQISRGGGHEKIYRTLSEGEKTLITLLYFLEYCKGSIDRSASVSTANRIVIIDDPISSLSHNHVYDVAALIQSEVIESKFKQVFILTHSLFFMHELIKLKEVCTDKAVKGSYEFFRVIKNPQTQIRKMAEKDIQNDYQSFWAVLKDGISGKVNAVVVANMMRNILEHYFTFVHQKDKLKKALDELGGKDIEFKALYRYINRQSHSDGINLHDFGSIDGAQYLERFRRVFQTTGFEDHYRKMMGTEDQPENADIGRPA